MKANDLEAKLVFVVKASLKAIASDARPDFVLKPF